MNILQNVSLAEHSTMRLGGTASYLCEVTNRMEVLEALSWAQQHQLPVRMIGSGSNIVWRDEGFPGLIIVNKLLRFEIFNELETNSYVTIGAGENWDDAVERTVQAGLTGIEHVDLGGRGRTSNVRAILTGATLANLVAAKTQLESFNDGVPRVFYDSSGFPWKNVLLKAPRFEPFRPNGGIGY